jgi:hypothetical protein
MWDELRYRWKLRKYLTAFTLTKRVHASTTDFTRREGEPDLRRGQQKEIVLQENELAVFRSDWLVEQAYLWHVPIPDDENSWMHSRFVGKDYLTTEAAAKLRAAIWAERKSNWEFWQARVTLGLAIVGSVFGVLAFFKR